MKKIVVVEDYGPFRRLVKREIVSDLEALGLAFEFVELAYESDAKVFFSNPSNAPAALIIVDLSLVWSDDPIGNPEPEEVIRGGMQDAGYRVVRLIRDMECWRSAPVIVYSSRGLNGIPERFTDYGITAAEVLPKEDTAEALLKRIRDIFTAPKQDC